MNRLTLYSASAGMTYEPWNQQYPKVDFA